MVDLSIRAGSISTNVHPDEFIISIDESKQDDDKKLLVIEVQASSTWWLADLAVLAIQRSQAMRQVPSLFESLGHCAPFICIRWSLEELMLEAMMSSQTSMMTFPTMLKLTLSALCISE